MSIEQDTREIVFELLSDIAPEFESESDLDVTADLRDEVDLDSMDFLNLVTAVAERFGVEIPESCYQQLMSFNDIVNYVEDRRISS